MSAINDTIDEPHHKRLTGLDITINRYHIINPDKDELMIRELRSKGYAWIIGLIVFGVLGGFQIFLGFYYLVTESSLSAFFFCFFLGLLGGVLPAALVVFTKFSRKACWHFTNSDLIITNSFGRKKTFKRVDVKSVFIHETQNYRNGVYSSSYYQVYAKINGIQHEKGHYPLILIDDEDVAKSPGFGIRFAGIFGPKAETEQIADLISEHWKIPVSV